MTAPRRQNKVSGSRSSTPTAAMPPELGNEFVQRRRLFLRLQWLTQSQKYPMAT